MKGNWESKGLDQIDGIERCMGAVGYDAGKQVNKVSGTMDDIERGSKTEIDFVLIEEGCVDSINRMKTYEEGVIGMQQRT